MSSARLLVILSVCLSFWCEAQVHTGTGFWIQELSAELTPGQVVSPCSTQTNHRGAGGCIMNRGGSPTSIRCEIVHTVEDWVDITIQRGLPGSEGSVIHHFTEREFFGFFRGEIVRSTFFLIEDDDDQDEIPFLNGEWFIQVTSDSCPNGALRGQFTAEYNIASLLRGFNEVPPISSPDQGYALGVYNPAPSSRSLDTFIEHTLQEATIASINQGAALQRGEVLLEYDSVASPITGSIQLDADLEEKLYEGNLYFNIKSRNFPNGEIRDQLHVIDAIPRINYAFNLDSSQLVPAASSPSNRKGYAIFSVNCDTGYTEYMIVHDIPNPQTISLHFGAQGEEGPSIQLLNGIVSPVLGNITLSAGQYVSLLSNLLYVEITSEEQTGDFPIIRGQITNQYSAFAYLSGTQEVPIVTTAAKGIALLNINSNSVDYVIHYDNLDTVLSIQLFEGVVGVNGESVVSISGSGATTRTGSFSFTGSVGSGEYYLSISSSRFPSGEIRGQIYSVFEICRFPPVVPPSEVTVVEIDSSSSSGSFLAVTINIMIVCAMVLL